MAQPLSSEDPEPPRAATQVTPKQLLKQGTPAQLRDAIVPEEHERFDTGYQRALDTARVTLNLIAVEEFLRHWRRVAATQAHMGHDAYRAMLTKAEHILQHRYPLPRTTTYTAEDMRRQVAERLAAGR